MNPKSSKNQESRQVSAAINGPITTENGLKDAVFVDNRPEATSQLKLQELAVKSSRTKQLKVFQRIMSNGTDQVQGLKKGKKSSGNGLVQRISDEQKIILKDFKSNLEISAAKALEALSKSPTMEDFRIVVNQLSPFEVNSLTEKAKTDKGLIRDDVQPYIEWFGEVRNERIASSAESMEGSMNWVTSGIENAKGKVVPKLTGKGKKPGGEEDPGLVNAYTSWMRRKGPMPKDDSNMNCWEACLFAGFKAGVLHPKILYNIYEIAKEAGQKEFDKGSKGPAIVAAYFNGVAAVLGSGEESWNTGDPAIPRGHLIFFNGPSHVAVSRGNLDKDGTPAVMSLWYLPGPKPNVQATSIGKILEAASSEYTITFGPAPF